jgi:protoporphyrinogen oxidase
MTIQREQRARESRDPETNETTSEHVEVSREPLGPVVIIGGGPAGLTAALELVRADIHPVVLEADQQVGGISKTVEREGWRFDIGGHRFFTKVARVRDFWHGVLDEEEFPTRDRLSRIYYQNKFFDYPIKPFNALRNLGPLESVRCVGSYVWTRLNPPKDQSDFESWVAARFGWRLYRIFFKTYTEKVWGVPATDIRSDWAAQRIKGLSLPSAALNAFRTYFVQTKHVSLIDRFEYPRLGPGQMWESAADLVRAGGGDVRLQSKAVTLFRDDAGVIAVATETDGVRETLAADHVISSMPLGELALAMSPLPPEHVVDAAKALSHRDFLTIALVVPEAHSFPDNWIYVHDPSVKLGRVQNFRSWSPDMVKPGSTCLGLEYFVFEGDELWKMDDDDLVEFAIEEITRLALIPPGVVERGFVVRVPQAYPVYDADYAEHVTTIRTWLESATPNVHPVGRNGMHRYNNQDHSMLTAMLAVENILGAHHDVWSVNVDEEYHEAGDHTVTPRPSKILDGVSGTGRSVPEFITRSSDERATSPRAATSLLVGLSRRSPLARHVFRAAFRSILDGRRQLRRALRAVSPNELLERPTVERLRWRLYRAAFALSGVRPLRRAQFALRAYASRSRRQTVAVEDLLIGGWNGLAARRFAEASGLLLDPSTRLVDSAQVDLLRRFDAVGESLYEEEALRATPYFTRVSAAASISGHHRGARTDEELAQLAREFLDRYRDLPVPYRPGRSNADDLPRVRRIAHSRCYEIRDGHHRLAIAAARGESEVEVVVERAQSTTPLQRLLHQMSWLDGQERLYQPVAFPEVATWPVMRRCSDRLTMMLDFLARRESPTSGKQVSYLDVGACYGWFVAAMVARDFDAHGVERDPLAQSLSELAYGLEPGRLVIGDAIDVLGDSDERYDVVSCFSMLHHFVLGRTGHTPETLLSRLDDVTRDVLFLDTGEAHESWFRLVLPEWTPSYARTWILEHSTFTHVQILGTDRDDVAPFEGKYGRTLFACTR